MIRNPAIVTLYTLVVAGVGAVLAYLIGMPVYILVGPAIAVSLFSLTGARFAVHDRLRDVAFVFLGIGIGSGVSPDTTAALVRWPLAFVILAVVLIVIMVSCRIVLTRGFGMDRRSAALASAPGHLSFVMGLSAQLNLDVGRIAVIQSVRLLSLTLFVPLIASAFGVDAGSEILPQGRPMGLMTLALLFVGAGILGLLFTRLRVPAPLLMGGLVLSAALHASEVVPEVLPEPIALASFAILGALIGARFSGVTLAQLRAAGLAGVVITVISVAVAGLAALPVAALLEMPPPHVLIAFAPGGLETMIALGLALGANPGFVAAAHVARLLMLVVLIPVMLGRDKPLSPARKGG